MDSDVSCATEAVSSVAPKRCDGNRRPRAIPAAVCYYLHRRNLWRDSPSRSGSDTPAPKARYREVI